MKPGLRLDKFPVLCSCDKSVRVELTVPIFVTKRPARSCFFPVGVLRIDCSGRLDANMLNVAPSKIGTCEMMSDR